MKDDISNSATAVKDPVCGMTVNPATAKHTSITPENLSIFVAPRAPRNSKRIQKNI
jgi:hypothetical protein